MPETHAPLDLGSFKHVLVPIGVVIGLAVARLMTATGQYLQQRQRVRFSVGHAIWCAFLFLWLVGLWWTVWGLRRADADVWTYFALMFLLIGPCLLYVAVTLVVPDVPVEGELDLATSFETLGRPFFLCLAGVVVWLVLAEVWLLREPWFLVPKRMLQGCGLFLFALGVAVPSRRMATALGVVALPLLLLVLGTVRAKLG